MSKIRSTLTSTLAKVAAAAALLIAGQAQALTLLGQPPAPAVIVSAGGLEWVWASPCGGDSDGPDGCTTGSVLLHNGFVFPTATQWTNSFADLAALIAAFDAPQAQLCASTYFSTSYDNCDSGDLGIGAVWHSPLADQQLVDNPAAETFLVRQVGDPDPRVPEPASLALAGLALAGLALARRRKSS